VGPVEQLARVRVGRVVGNVVVHLRVAAGGRVVTDTPSDVMKSAARNYPQSPAHHRYNAVLLQAATTQHLVGLHNENRTINNGWL
jgi:hypothetical protein